MHYGPIRFSLKRTAPYVGLVRFKPPCLILNIMKNILDKAAKILGSLKLSFVLLVILGLFLAQRAIIAQKFVYLEDPPWFLRALTALGLGSPRHLEGPLYIALALFVVNLGFSSVRMARRIIAKQRGFTGFRSAEGIRTLSNSAAFQAPGGSATGVEKFLKGKGLRTAVENSGNETRIRGERRRLGHWGVFFLHLTFLVVLVGALLSVFTRHAGYFELSPGETFIEKHENYLVVTEKPKLFGGDRRFAIKLEQIDLAYWRPGEEKQRASVVSVFDPNGTFMGKKRVEVNSPIRAGGMNIYQGSRHGFIAGLEVRDTEGTMAPGTVRFMIPRKPGQGMTNKVTLPTNDNLELELELFTENLGDIKGLEQFGPKYMASLMTVVTVEGGHRFERGAVFLGWQSLDIGGLELRFVSLKPYTSFVVTRDYGIPLIFTGFVFLITGLAVTYFWVPEYYWAVIRNEDGGESVIIGAITEKFKGSFRERFMAEVEELKAEFPGQ